MQGHPGKIRPQYRKGRKDMKIPETGLDETTGVRVH
jgi:hypothetical protein